MRPNVAPSIPLVTMPLVTVLLVAAAVVTVPLVTVPVATMPLVTVPLAKQGCKCVQARIIAFHFFQNDAASGFKMWVGY